jgi:hypothetical protein
MVSSQSLVAGRPPTASLFVAVGILFSSTWAAVAQQTCSARCPNGSMSEVYNCNSNYVPLCLRAPSAPRGGFVAPPPQSAPAQPTSPQERAASAPASAEEVSAFADLVHHMNQVVPGVADERLVSTSSYFLQWRLQDDNQRLNDVIGRAETRLDEAIYESNRAKFIDAVNMGLNIGIEKITAQNAKIQMYITYAQLGTRDLQEYERRQRALARDWLDYIRPRDVSGTYNNIITDKLTPLAEVPVSQDYVAPVVAAESHSKPHSVPLQLADNYATFEKINLIHRRLNYLSSINEKIDETHKEYDLEWLNGQVQRLHNLEYLSNKVTFDQEQLLKQVPAVHANFVVAAVEAFAWKTYTGDITIPEAMKFYELNKSWYQLGLTDDKVRQGLQAEKFALSVLSPDAKGMKEFVDVQDRTLGLLGDAQRFMSEAPNIIANGTPEDMQALLESITNKQSDFNLALMKDAAKSLGPYPPFAQAVINGYVPLPYQSIAKKLGLTQMLGIGD